MSPGAQGMIYNVLAACRGRLRRAARGWWQQAHGTIDWAPQAETSQFRAPVSRDRLGLLSYKIAELFFSHLPKKRVFLIPQANVFKEKVLDFRLKKEVKYSCMTLVVSLLFSS